MSYSFISQRSLLRLISGINYRPTQTTPYPATILYQSYAGTLPWAPAVGGHMAHSQAPPLSSTHLTAFDTAAVWRERPLPVSPKPRLVSAAMRGCSGSVVSSGRGPGTWRWSMNDVPESTPYSDWPTLQGASYITLPKALPPDATTANWLSMEGLFGLVWRELV